MLFGPVIVQVPDVFLSYCIYVWKAINEFILLCKIHIKGEGAWWVG